MQKLLDGYQQSLVGGVGTGQGRTHHWSSCIPFSRRAFFDTLVLLSVTNVGILIRKFSHIGGLVQLHLKGLLKEL